jgi:hypothetical protein
MSIDYADTRQNDDVVCEMHLTAAERNFLLNAVNEFRDNHGKRWQYTASQIADWIIELLRESAKGRQ